MASSFLSVAPQIGHSQRTDKKMEMGRSFTPNEFGQLETNSNKTWGKTKPGQTSKEIVRGDLTERWAGERGGGMNER